MKIALLKQVIILALLIFFVGMIHIWDLPRNLLSSMVSGRDLASTTDKNENIINKNPITKMTRLDQTKVEKVVDVETRQLDCQSVSELYVKNLSLRLEGKCAYELESVTNRTNGFTASVFNKEKSFTTDYISLSVGKNLIEINYRDEKNQDIIRQLPVIVTE
jgi:hypothetical protein